MPDSAEQTPLQPRTARKRSRIGEYAGVLVVIALVVIAAFYQEQLTAFFTMKQWDKGAPARTVERFLTAAKQGDQAAATALLGDPGIKPTSSNGKWTGFLVASIAGTMLLPNEELVPAGEIKAVGTDFIYVEGKGAAEVKVPDAKGTPIVYRLEMKNNDWKITEIRGGHPATAPKPSGKQPSGKPSGKSTSKVPH